MRRPIQVLPFLFAAASIRPSTVAAATSDPAPPAAPGHENAPESQSAPAPDVPPLPPCKGSTPSGWETKFSVMAGLLQWVALRGGNIAFEYKADHWVFEVSHGQGLDLNQLGGAALSSAERDAGARVLVPWTTGFGVGYRLTENLHFLVEFKAHRYDVTTADSAAHASYTTFSIGPSAFYSVYLYKGLFLEPNVRFWPTVASTLSNDEVALRQADGATYLHRAHDWGLFANVNVGYSF